LCLRVILIALIDLETLRKLFQHSRATDFPGAGWTKIDGDVISDSPTDNLFRHDKYLLE
jgi:hypothetical protein